MNTKAIGVLVAGILVVVAVAVVFFGTDVFAEPFWETETDFGEWQTGITIGYTDGTTQELKIIQDNKGSWYPFAVKYDGQEIDWILFYIRGLVTDLGGYDSIKIDASSIGTQWYIFTTPDSDDISQIKDSGSVAGSGTKTLYLNTEYTILECQLELDNNDGDGIMSGYTDGTYIITFTPNGDCQYWGYPGGEGDKNDVALPSGQQVNCTVEDGGEGGQIIITLSSGIETG